MGKHYGLAIRNFIQLNDTPSSYSGQAAKLVAVNTGEDALEFSELSTGDITKLEVTALEFIFDGMGSALPAGKYLCMRVPFAGTIKSLTMLADDFPTSTKVDIFKGSFTDYLAGLTSIVGPTLPELSTLSGTHTGPNHPTVMTDASANFVPGQLVGLIILNNTDGSSGVIIANTVTTVTVTALEGGTLNQWSTGDSYSIPRYRMEDTSLSGWTTNVAAGDIIECSIAATDTITLLTVILKIERS